MKMAGSRGNPRIIVQCDWDQALRENDGNAWVSFRRPGEDTVYGDIKTYGITREGRPYVTCSENFRADNISSKRITMAYEDDIHHTCTFQAPNVTFSTVHNPQKKIECIDVTEGGLAVSCDSEGKLKIWTTDLGEIRRNLEGHLGDAYTCRFFPSGLVVLSGGVDMQLKIWSAETGKCAATLQGHKEGITDTAIVERGRNILSTSRDGTVKLWDCGKAECITTFSEIGGGIINGCSLGVPHSEMDLGLSADPQSTCDQEVGTEGKLLLLACELGTLHGYSLSSKTKVFEVKCSDEVMCCSLVSDLLAVSGARDGRICLYDLRNTQMPVKEIQENRASILSILPHKQGVFVTTADGSCFYINEQYDTTLELTGPDCDPVYKVVSDGKYHYTSCRDGNIRKYRLEV